MKERENLETEKYCRHFYPSLLECMEQSQGLCKTIVKFKIIQEELCKNQLEYGRECWYIEDLLSLKCYRKPPVFKTQVIILVICFIFTSLLKFPIFFSVFSLALTLLLAWLNKQINVMSLTQKTSWILKIR